MPQSPIAESSPTRREILTPSGHKSVEIRVHDQRSLAVIRPEWGVFVGRRGRVPLSCHPAWLKVLEQGLRHVPYLIEAAEGDEIVGLLPLAFVQSRLFGRFLVGLPYLNYGGVIADDELVSRKLIDKAIELAEELDVRHLELRHKRAIEHPRLTTRTGHKVHMIRELPASPEVLLKQLQSNVRNHIRKGQKNGLVVSWGGEELLPEFYDIFCQNMRDLGTPVYSIELFRAALRQFPDRVELCVVRLGTKAVAAGMPVHGWKTTEIPSASSLRPYNSTNANSLMYWNLLERAIQRGQETFDFGRSTPETSVCSFKEQWGAKPEPAEWQYYVRAGNSDDMRPDNPRYQMVIDLWKRLPVGLTRLIGPIIVRGIP
jgi:FemAB-related protein (PEP-CTERM system-associated)